MTREESVDLDRWIAAEWRRDDAGAEPVFRRLVASVGRRAAPRSRIEHLVTALGWRHSPAAKSRLRRLGGWTLLALAGVIVSVIVVTVLGPIVAGQLIVLLNLSVQGFVWLVQAFQSGRDVWEVIAAGGRALGDAIASPRVAAGFVVLELIGVAALYALHRVLGVGNEEEK